MATTLEQTTITLTSDPSSGCLASKTAPHLTMTFPMTFQTVPGHKLALENLVLPFSWYNISAAFNNQKFSYRWSDGVEYPVTLDEGSYQVTDINGYLQNLMRFRGHYLRDADGLEVFYIKLQVSDTYYKILVTLTQLPSSLPAGWTNPSNLASNLSGLTPTLIIPVGGMSKLLGYAPAEYGTVTPLTKQFLSTTTPAVDVITAISVNCSWVNALWSSTPSRLGSFTTADATFGTPKTYTPPVLSYVSVTPNQYSTLVLTFVDQTGRALVLNDLEGLMIQLSLRYEEPRATSRLR
jgi:hypothetical protein